MVARVTAHLRHEPSEHEKLVRELLTAEVADAYLDLTERGPRPPAEDPVDAELVARHLAYVQRSAGTLLLRPVEPLIAVTGLLTQVHRELTKQHDRLLQGYVAAAEMHQLQLHDRRESDVPSVLAQVLTDADEIAERWTTSIHTVQCTYRSITVHDASSQPTVVLPSPLASQCDSMTFRELCTPKLLADPAGAEAVRAAVEAGVEVRTAQLVPARMLIVDDHFALVGLVPTGATGALLIRSSVVIAALTQYYDQIWATATPVLAPGAAHPPRATRTLGTAERDVLGLLVHGLKDEAIARHLNLSVRTVRRHIAAIMEYVEAPTRFAAGAAAQRLGLLG